MPFIVFFGLIGPSGKSKGSYHNGLVEIQNDEVPLKPRLFLERLPTLSRVGWGDTLTIRGVDYAGDSRNPNWPQIISK